MTDELKDLGEKIEEAVYIAGKIEIYGKGRSRGLEEDGRKLKRVIAEVFNKQDEAIKALRAELAEKDQQILTQVNTMSEQAYKIGELTGENNQLRKQLEEAREILELKSEAKCTCGRKAYNLTTEIRSWHGNDENKLSILQTFVCRSCERIFNEVKEMFKTKPPQETQPRQGVKDEVTRDRKENS